MNWSDVGSTIIKFGAPLLGSVIPTPGAGAIINEIISAFGGNNSTTAQDLINKIQSDPNATVKLKQIEADRQVELLQIKKDMASAKFASQQSLAETDLQNTENARKTNVESNDNTFKIIAISYQVGFFAYLFLSKLFPTIYDHDLMQFLEYGELIILGYFFGSSASSALKNKFLFKGDK